MTSNGEWEIISALEEVLALYDIKLDEKIGNAHESSADYSEIITKSQRKLDELNESAAEIFNRIGMTREQLEVYANNPDNFTPEQWEALQKVKRACEKYQQQARDALEATIDKQELKEVAEKRKKDKGRFVKKKHWLSL